MGGRVGGGRSGGTVVARERKGADQIVRRRADTDVFPEKEKSLLKEELKGIARNSELGRRGEMA